MGSLTKIASKLAHNPIGIIALFIVLVEAIAGSAFIYGSVSEFQGTIITWFMVIFPLPVLGCFIYLVVRHTGKLYAPGDFADQSHFLQAIGLQVESKLEKINYDALSEVARLDIEMISHGMHRLKQRPGDAIKKFELLGEWINRLENEAQKSEGTSKITYLSALRMIYPEYLRQAAQCYGSATPEYQPIHQRVMKSLNRIANNEF